MEPLHTVGSVSTLDSKRASASTTNDWELSKENVLPLRQGRRVAVLNSSLQPTALSNTADNDTNALWRQTAEQRRRFELEIRTYTGCDPLDPWYRYIQWTEQHNPRGCHADRLVEKCVALFRHEDRYRQDTRYVQLWLEMARNSLVPLQVFQFMFQHGIGTQLAALYVGWAWQHELAGNMARADAVLAQGVRAEAQPGHVLAETRRKLQERVAMAVAAAAGGSDRIQTPVGPSTQAPCEGRRALGQLVTAPDGAVPHVRGAAALVQQRAPFRSGSVAASRPNQPSNRSLFVYRDTDENTAPAEFGVSDRTQGSSSSQSRPLTSLPVASAKQKENVRRAGPWSQPVFSTSADSGVARASSRAHHSLTSRQRVTASGATTIAGFQVLVDDDGERPATQTPTAASHSSSVLSVRSAGKVAAPVDSTWNLPVALFEPPDPKVHVMYCKDVIYAGVEEVSFEELRSVEWLRRRDAETKRNSATSAGAVLRPLSLNTQRFTGDNASVLCATDSVTDGESGSSVGDSDKENQPPDSYVPPSLLSERRPTLGTLVDVTSLVAGQTTDSSTSSSVPPSSSSDSSPAADRTESENQSYNDRTRAHRRLLLDSLQQPLTGTSLVQPEPDRGQQRQHHRSSKHPGSDGSMLELCDSSLMTDWSSSVCLSNSTMAETLADRSRLCRSFSDFRSLLTPATRPTPRSQLNRTQPVAKLDLNYNQQLNNTTSCVLATQFAAVNVSADSTAADPHESVDSLSQRCPGIMWLLDQPAPSVNTVADISTLQVADKNYRVRPASDDDKLYNAAELTTVVGGTNESGSARPLYSIRMLRNQLSYRLACMWHELSVVRTSACSSVTPKPCSVLAYGDKATVLVNPWMPTLAEVRSLCPSGPVSCDALALLLTAEVISSVQRIHNAGFVLGAKISTANVCVNVGQVEMLLSRLTSAGKMTPSDFTQLMGDGCLVQLSGDFDKAMDINSFPDPTAKTCTRLADFVAVAVSVSTALLFGSTDFPDRGAIVSSLRRYWSTETWRRFFCMLDASDAGWVHEEEWHHPLIAAAFRSPKLPALLQSLVQNCGEVRHRVSRGLLH